MKKLFKRVKRKSVNTLSKLIPYNRHFKPLKAYKTSKEYYNQHKHTQGPEYIELYPHYNTRLKVSEKFMNDISPYCIYDEQLPDDPATFTVTTDYFLIALPNGRIYSNNIDTVAIISGDNNLLGDISLQFHPQRAAKAEENTIFKQKFFTAPKKYNGLVFNMLSGGASVDNYGHWLLDVLPRIYLLKESGWFAKVNWFVVPNYTYDYQKESLKLLGIAEDQVIQGNEHFHIIADTLIACSAPRGTRSYLMPEWVIDFHKNVFLPKKSRKGDSSPFIYISRRDGGSRKVLNEEKVIIMLESYNFQIIELSSYTLTEKIGLFNAAKVVISIVGAAMTNVMYCQKGTKILEIFPDVLVDTYGYNLAVMAQAEYNYLICKTEVSTKQISVANNTHLTIDVAELENLVKQLISDMR